MKKVFIVMVIELLIISVFAQSPQKIVTSQLSLIPPKLL